MTTLYEGAFAKLNLTLDVLGKREDGYHDLKSVMQTISVRDDIEIDVGTGKPWCLLCDKEDIPCDERNLAWKAAKVYFETIGKDPDGLEIRITKRIPSQAGMGGGSADAAAVLRALNRHYDYPLSIAALAELGSLVGSRFQKPSQVLGGAILLLLGIKILLEPGRRLVGNAAVMLTTCIYEKKGEAKTFKMIDAGMNDIIRPALYEGYHEIWPVREHSGDAIVADVVGPVCESGDFQAQNRLIADVQPGEVLAEMSAGAYGFSMSSTYNSRPLAAEVLVDGDKWSIIRRRQTLEQMVQDECLPE